MTSNETKIELMIEDRVETEHFSECCKLYFGGMTKIHLANTEEEFDALLKAGLIPNEWWENHVIFLWEEMAFDPRWLNQYVRCRYYHWARCYWDAQWFGTGGFVPR